MKGNWVFCSINFVQYPNIYIFTFQGGEHIIIAKSLLVAGHRWPEKDIWH